MTSESRYVYDYQIKRFMSKIKLQPIKTFMQIRRKVNLSLKSAQSISNNRYNHLNFPKAHV